MIEEASKERGERLRGAHGFEAYYRRVWGERWPSLQTALIDRPRPVAWLNPFTEAVGIDELSESVSAKRPAGCVPYEGGNPERDERGLLGFYVLDPASVWVARSLEVRAGERVLDLCAAPGGKTLVLCEALVSDGELVANDRSPARSARLRRVLDDYLPPGVRRRVQVTRRDGRRLGLLEPEAFDAILLDAPCSSERHVLGDPGELAKWSAGRVKRLAQEQYALLTSAWLALKPGGRLVYSTCAVAPDENDAVIARLLERGRHPVRVEALEFPTGEPTRFGWQMLPDRDACGPLYSCRLVK